MNYPTELQRMLEEKEANEFKKRKCLAAEKGGCFCTGWCEGKDQEHQSFTYDSQGTQ